MSNTDPEPGSALDILLTFVTNAICARNGIPITAEPLTELAAPTYADMEVMPGDLHRLTGFGREENGS